MAVVLSLRISGLLTALARESTIQLTVTGSAESCTMASCSGEMVKAWVLGAETTVPPLAMTLSSTSDT